MTTATGGRGTPQGMTLVEALVALVLLLLLVNGALAVVARQTSAVVRVLGRADALAAERLVRTLLLEETRGGWAGSDWAVVRPGVLAVRAYRSWGTVCPTPSPAGDLRVRVGGIRAANPAKDSVAVLTTEGWRVADLVLREPEAEACPDAPSWPVERWRLAPPVPGAVLVRAFERGSYHLEDAALRYRSGDGGRQPLTPEVLDPDATTIEAGPGGGRIRVSARGGGGGWTRRLGGGRLP